MLLFAVAAFKFVYQDILRQEVLATDFRSAYLSARLWMRGEQPYAPGNVAEEARRVLPTMGAQAAASPDLLYTLYPPSCFPVLLPLATLPWRAAAVLELTCCVLAYLWLVYLCGLKLNGTGKLYFYAFALAFAPFHAGLELGNLSAISGPLACASVLLADVSPVSAAVVLGLATALKPQLAGLFLLYFLLQRCWKICLVASAIGASCLLAGVGWIRFHGLYWFSAYAANINRRLSPYGDGRNSVTWSGRINFQLLNVQPLLFWMTGSLHRAVLLSRIIFILLLAVVCLLIYRYRGRSVAWVDRLETVSLLSMLSFVAVYQHSYSSIPVLFVLLWAIVEWKRPLAKVLLGWGLIFLVPITKLPVLVSVVERKLGHHAATIAAPGGELLQAGVPSGLGTTPLQELALALPELFIVAVIALFTLDLAIRQRTFGTRRASLAQEGSAL